MNDGPPNRSAVFIFLMIIALTMQSCASLPNLWGENQSPVVNVPALIATEMPTSTVTIVPATGTFTPTITPAPTLTATLIPTQESPSTQIKHVIVITYDGMRGDAVAAAPMP